LSDWVVAGAGSRSGSLAGSVEVRVVLGAYASALSVRCVLSGEIPASAVSGAPGEDAPSEDVPDEDAPDSEVEAGEGETDVSAASGPGSSGGAPFSVSGFAPYSFVG
jgi:hypothetical protein